GKQFAQPIRPRDGSGQPKRHLMKQTLRDRSLDVLEVLSRCIEKLAAGRIAATPEHIVTRYDFREVLTDKRLRFDAVYADPPYTRDHYSRYYHVLETMSLHDEPDVSTTKIRNAGVAKPS